MRSYKGKFIPTNPKKYLGDVNSIIYRSLLERRFMVYCDQTPKVLKWTSEEVVVPYISPVDNKMHRYFVDFFVEVQTKSGEKQGILKSSRTPSVFHPNHQKNKLADISASVPPMQ